MVKGQAIERTCAFNMECDLVQYENKVEITTRIHSWNLLGENNIKMFKNHFKKTVCR
jgi:hypothetical protein